ncbi:MAG: homoserine kinase [Nitrospirae bacterium]|nr:homoserine kinase [Candidatus Manganitrophaceae bacterium]
MKSVRVFAPASVGNIGPGFDVLGMALAGMGDTVTAMRRSEPGVSITEITGDRGRLSYKAEENTAGIAVQTVLTHLGIREGVQLTLHKGVPGTGLGSSAASAVAGAYAVNLLFGEKLSKAELIPLAAVAESQVSRGFFLDNVGPSMMGGITWNNPFTKEVVPLGRIDKAVIIIATPDFPLLTRESRRVLPRMIPMENFISNMAYASMITWAVAKKDPVRFGRSIQDRVAEPARAPLIKGFEDVKKAALTAGAFGCSISGAGASIFAVTDDSKKGEKIGKAMERAFQGHQVLSEIRIAQMDRLGARMVK